MANIPPPQCHTLHSLPQSHRNKIHGRHDTCMHYTIARICCVKLLTFSIAQFTMKSIDALSFYVTHAMLATMPELLQEWVISTNRVSATNRRLSSRKLSSSSLLSDGGVKSGETSSAGADNLRSTHSHIIVNECGDPLDIWYWDPASSSEIEERCVHFVIRRCMCCECRSERALVSVSSVIGHHDELQ